MYTLETIDLAAARRQFRERLLDYLDGLKPALRGDVYAALAVDGKLLHEPASELDGRWALLLFYLIQDLCVEMGTCVASSEGACDVALAMECVVCATDLLDDVMDDDTTPLIEQLGMARVLNAALALVSLSQRMLLALLDLDLPVTLPARLLDVMQRAILQASAGQQQDLLAERRPACDLTREECLEIAAAKAGALLGLACQMGALCAGMNGMQVERCAEAGNLLGIAAQLDNDAHDLYMLLQPADQGKRQKSDLARRKKTLPVVLAARSLQMGDALDVGRMDFRSVERLTGDEREIYFNALREGILTTWGMALLYRERAREAFEKLMPRHSLSPTLCRVLGFDPALTQVTK